VSKTRTRTSIVERPGSTRGLSRKSTPEKKKKRGKTGKGIEKIFIEMTKRQAAYYQHDTEANTFGGQKLDQLEQGGRTIRKADGDSLEEKMNESNGNRMERKVRFRGERAVGTRILL